MNGANYCTLSIGTDELARKSYDYLCFVYHSWVSDFIDVFFDIASQGGVANLPF